MSHKPLRRRSCHVLSEGAFFGKIQIQKRILSFFGQIQKRIINHKIYTQGGFFGLHPNPDFWDSQSERFFGKGFELESILEFWQAVFRKKKFGTQQMPYMYDF